MANNQSIVSLKLDSGNYDANLKRAQQGLLAMEKECRAVGGTLAYVEKEQLSYVQALGQMETKSQSVKSKVGELTGAFTELKAMYNRMTEEEKQSPFGQEMSKSLDQLKGRLREGQSELKDINSEISNNGSLLDQLSSKFGVNIKQLAGWGAAIGAGKVALDVMKDAFFSNEEQLDEWGRIVESSHSLYSAFLDSLNTGDISGYLKNITKIIDAARDAYDALDTLNTHNAFNQINIEKTRTGLTGSIADYREGKGSRGEVKQAGAKYKKELKARYQLERQTYIAKVKEAAAQRGVSAQDLYDALSGSWGDYNVIKSLPLTGKKYKSVWDGLDNYKLQEVAVPANRKEKLGAALRRFNDTELKELQAYGAQAQRTLTEVAQVDKQMGRILGRGDRTSPSTGGRTSGNVSRTPRISTVAHTQKEVMSGPLIDLENKLKDLQKAQHQAASPEEWQNYESQIKQVQDEIDAFKGKVKEVTLVKGQGFDASNAGISWLMGDIKSQLDSAEFGTELYNNLSAQLADANSFKNIIEQWIGAGLDLSGIDTSSLWQQLFDGENISDDVWQNLIDTINAKLEEMELDPIKLNIQTGGIEKVKKQGDDSAKAWNGAASAFGAAGNALAQLAGDSSEAAAATNAFTIAGAIAQLVAQFAAMPKGVEIWSWIAGTTAGVATLITAIASIKSATAGSYAEGGIVPGNNYSGDNLVANVNSGEVILNRAQQDNIASQLQGGNQADESAQPYVQGEMVYLGIKNFLNRSGRGELITSRNINKYIH